MMIKHVLKIVLASLLLLQPLRGQEPVRIGVAGLSHSHVLLLLRNLDRDDIEIVGIAEADHDLARRYAERFGFDPALVYEDLETMLDRTAPEGVVTFTSIYDHLEVVQACAPRGIHVMVEKPLAVSVNHARQIEQLADQHGIMVYTNYETTWYPANHEVFRMTGEQELGTLRKMIVYDGHRGPREINVNEEFLAWLTDPVKNGGGAVTDFGCYGADLVTWIMGGQKPESVYGSLKQYKPRVYPHVDDDATLILSYPSMECVIHASWNWPFNRKDMHVYGTTGYVFQDDAVTLRYRLNREDREQTRTVPRSAIPHTDPFAYFSGLVRGTITPDPNNPGSLQINMTVVEILEAARESNKTGQKIMLNP